MSVNHSYFSLDWNKIPDVNDRASFNFIFDLMDEGPFPEWIADVHFGKQVDDYLFSSWNGFMSFKDWFMNVRSSMNPALVAQFTSLYQDVGLLMNDNYSYVPIKKDINFEDDWLLGAIPPSDVDDLLSRAEQIDVALLTSEFQKALNQQPLPLFESGETVGNWLLALKDGLRDVKKRGFGLIVGAA